MKKNRKRTCLKVCGIMLVVVLAISGIFAVIGAVGTSANMRFAENNEKVEIRKLLIEKDELGYWTITNEADTNFKILQLTDIHIGNGFLSIGKDNKAMNAVKKIVNYAKPDLIIVTGDMVYPVPIQSGSANNVRETKLFATLMDGFEIPWTVTFGNHDEEWYSYYSLKEVAEVYESFDNYCLFQRGPEDVQGMSNHIINIKNADGSLNTSLVIMDSNSYVKGEGMNAYDNIHEDQVEWYEDELYRVAENYGYEELMPSIAFFHIPINEFQDAWTLYREGSDEVSYHYGQAGEKGEGIYPSKYRSTIFDKMVELGSTKAVFCGHDHLNDFSITYKGIRLTYGKSIDYLAYFITQPGFTKKTFQRGGTIIEIDCNGELIVTPIALVDIP